MTTTPQGTLTAFANNPGPARRAAASLGAGCGTGSGIAALTSAVNSATTTLNNAINTLTSLPGLIQAQVNSVVNSALSNVLGEIRNATDPVLREINTLLSVLNNPTAFVAQWLRMQNLFPNLDLRRLFDDLLRGVGICQAASNAGGNPAQSPPPFTQAQGAPAPQPTPPPPTAGAPPNTSGASQANYAPGAVSSQPLSGPNPSLAQNTLGTFRFQESARLEVESLRLELERGFTSDPNERQRLAEEISEIRTRISELGSGGSGNQTQ